MELPRNPVIPMEMLDLQKLLLLDLLEYNRHPHSLYSCSHGHSLTLCLCRRESHCNDIPKTQNFAKMILEVLFF